MRRPRSLPLTLVLTVAMVFVTATAALAHPFVTDGATVPADSLATMTLEMGHGCGNESEGGGDPTLEIAMEVPDAVSYIEPLDTDGYEASTETDEDGRPEVVVWTATDGGVAAPAVPMDIVVDGESGDELFLKVFQGCEEFQYRWVGTPDEPADEPAIALTLTAPDPNAPPTPTEPALATPEDSTDEGAEDDPEPADASDPEPSDDEPPVDEQDEPNGDDPAAAVEGGDASPLPWLGIGLIVLAIPAALLFTPRRKEPSA